jgi:hypothetical protein
MVLVGVYVGRAAYMSPATPDRVAGGHGKEADTLGAIVPAPAPPVCHEEYVPGKGSWGAFNALHFPTLLRGSVGIQPFCSPSWYDHRGASTVFEVDELPTCQWTHRVSLDIKQFALTA